MVNNCKFGNIQLKLYYRNELYICSGFMKKFVSDLPEFTHQ